MKRRILFLSAYEYPEKTASSYLGQNRNDALAEAGFEMENFVPTPSRGISDEVRREYCKKEHKRETYNKDSLIVNRFAMIKEGRNPIQRALRYSLCWIVQLWKGWHAKDIDVVYLPSTPPIQGMIGAFLKKYHKIPFIYNLQDIFPDSLVGTGLTHKGSILWKIGRVVENYTYKHADKIIVIGADFKRNIMEKGVPEEKIEVVYNWVDENAVVPVRKEDNPLFEVFGISREKFHVVYAGNLGNAQNIDVIVDSAKELSGNTNIEFLIFGTGGLKEQFVENVKAYGIDNVKFFPLQPMERVSQVYGLGDVCVVSCKPGLGGAAMPSKMLSIMSAGRAVVASFDKGELTYILEQNKCGAYAPAGDAKAFAELISKMEANREECQLMGEKARELILQKFTRAYGTQRYVDIIRSVVK